MAVRGKRVGTSLWVTSLGGRVTEAGVVALRPNAKEPRRQMSQDWRDNNRSSVLVGRDYVKKYVYRYLLFFFLAVYFFLF